ncbi:MAG TPA: acylphosphatase [Tetrasphaera sp.]|nr:acylphosphatase [Tetrasphaera sp.]
MCEVERLVVHLSGRVQGVGMRWWVRARALELGLVGYARNTDDGRVEVCAEGPRAALDGLLALLIEVPSASRRPGAVRTVSPPVRGAASGRYDGFAER